MIRQFISAEPKRKRNSGPPFCYQQGDSDCGYYCLRIAAEIVLQRRFNSEEASTFRNEFLGMCLVSGQRLEFSIGQFAQHYPDMGVYFITEPDVFEFSPATVVEKLDAGCKALVLNIQNIKFKGSTFVRGRYGHNICCIGHKDGKLIFADSNRSAGSCRKTMDMAILQKGFDDIQQAIQDGSDEGESRQRIERQQHPTRIVEMFWATTELPYQKSVSVRRSKRLKK